MQTIKLIGRGSRLSLLQMQKVKEKIGYVYPSLNVEIIVKNSLGDALQDIPLHTVEGSDFFTQDIFETLEKGEADIAVHSLKDMSSEHFFGNNHFAVIDRDDVRDIAIFRDDIEEKLRDGQNIVIGTCSPRREEMALVFLKKALPQLGAFAITPRHIRGNVDTRLRKLDAGEYDGIILATAGLNRLLRSAEDASIILDLLKDKKKMLLPLIECVPAPCQGAIVAEAFHGNKKAIEVLNAINDESVYHDCVAEKKEAIKYGIGCIQKFGVTTIQTVNNKYIYSAGTDSHNNSFSRWSPLPELNTARQLVFSSTDHMKEFFSYQWKNEMAEIPQPVVFVANYKVFDVAGKEAFKEKTILASGTKTWFELSKKGYWVTASADGLGFEFLLPSFQMPLLNIQANEISILTHEHAAERWQRKGYNAIGNYRLVSAENKELASQIGKANFIFWSSFSQYEFYKQYCLPSATHACAGGETAMLLKAAGIEPVVFPTIKAFEQWRTSFTPHRSVA